jgi:glycosyltransferase involved in cell wall biosynthesis
MTISGTKNNIKLIRTKKITYIGIKNEYLQSSNNYQRALGDIRAILKLKKFYKNQNLIEFDQVIVYSPSIFWGLLISKLKKKTVSIKLGDLYPKWLVDHNIIGKLSLNHFFLKFCELLLYFQANNIFVQTKKDINYLSGYSKILRFKTKVIHNWISVDNLPNVKNVKRKKKYLRFIFLGVIGIAQDHELLFKIIKYCNDKNFESVFYFIGSGSQKENLIKLTLKYNNVFYFSEKNINQIHKIIKKCDVCLSTLSKNFYSENFPGKILTYMVNNKPILIHSPNNNFLKDLIENNSLGLYSSEENDLYKNIDFIFTNLEAFNKKGKNGLEVVKSNFSCENAKKILFNL